MTMTMDSSFQIQKHFMATTRIYCLYFLLQQRKCQQNRIRRYIFRTNNSQAPLATRDQSKQIPRPQVLSNQRNLTSLEKMHFDLFLEAPVVHVLILFRYTGSCLVKIITAYLLVYDNWESLSIRVLEYGQSLHRLRSGQEWLTIVDDLNDLFSSFYPKSHFARNDNKLVL